MKLRYLPLYFDRSFSKGVVKQIIWLVAIMLAVYLVLVLLSYSNLLYDSHTGSGSRWHDILLLLVDSGADSKAIWPPFAVVIAFIGIIIFGGMLISVITNILHRRVENYGAGASNYFFADHTIILGYNRSIPSLLKHISKENGKGAIVIMTQNESRLVREWIHANVDTNLDRRVVVLKGCRVAVDDLKRLNLKQNIRSVYIIGDEDEVDHDSMSLECVKMLAGLLPTSLENREVDCHVQIDSSVMFSLLQQRDFKKFANIDNSILNFLPFNFNQIWSEKALSTYPGSNDYIPLDGEGITGESQKRVHLFVVGMTQQGIDLALNAAHILHFPNFDSNKPASFSRITFVDPKADAIGEEFRQRYHTLFKLSRWKSEAEWHDPLNDEEAEYRHLAAKSFLDIEWEFLSLDFYSSQVEAYLRNCINDLNSIVTIAFCCDDSERNLRACLSLDRQLLKKANMVLIRQKESAVAVDILRLQEDYSRCRAFGMMEDCYGESLLTDRFGKIVNALYAEIDLEDTEKVEDAWKGLKIENRWSSNYSAGMLAVKLRSLGLDTRKIELESLEEALKAASQRHDIQRLEHNRWNFEKVYMGFSPLSREEQRLLEENKITEEELKGQKKHPDIVPYECLTPKVQKIDEIVNKLWPLYQQIVK